MKLLMTVALMTIALNVAFSQNSTETDTTKPEYKYDFHTTWLTFSNFGNSETNTQHYELRFGYQLSQKDKIGIKLTTWKLFAPMGIHIWDDKFLDKAEFYPGRLRETGIGLTYQRKLWKGLFATLEVLPLMTTYLNESGNKVGSGFKLYNSYHLGYHIPLFKKGRFYIEPQLHVNHWPINNGVHPDFKAKEENWNNFFLIEPNLYIGFKF